MTIPPVMHKGYNSPPRFQHFLFCFFFLHCSHPTVCEVAPHRDFGLHFLLMTNSVEYIFMCLLVISYLLWRNVCLSHLSIFKLGYHLICFLSYKLSLYILETRPLSDTRFANNLFHSVSWLFTFFFFF